MHSKGRDIHRRLHDIATALQDLSRYAMAPSTAVPAFLFVEPSNICNANCVFCPYPYDPRRKGLMETDRFRQVLEEFRTMGGTRLGLTPPFGEILTDLDVVEKLNYAHRLGFEAIHTFTNLTLLHRHDVTALLCSGLTSLHVSVAPLDRETYRKIYRINAYDQVLENLKQLLDAFHSTSGKTVRNLSIEFRADRSLADCLRLPDYRKIIAPRLGLGIDVRGFSAFDAWGGLITMERLLPGMRIKPPQRLKLLPCSRSSVLHVCVNGDVRACGCRYDLTSERDELLLGNVHTHRLCQLYRHPIVHALKKPGFSRHFAICRKCSWYSVY